MELSIREVARVCGVNEDAVYRWVEADGLPAHQVNDQLRVNRGELLEWANLHGITVSVALFGGEGSEMPTLAEALRAGGVIHDLAGDDKQGVLQALVAAMPLPEGTDRTFLLQVLIAREALGSTGIGDGIAIPHPRNPIVLRVPGPLVTLCFLRRPVDFGAIDGKPVSALFSLVCPTPKLHLHLLSRLAYVLRDPGCRAAIMARARPEEIFAEVDRVEAGLEAPRTGETL